MAITKPDHVVAGDRDQDDDRRVLDEPGQVRPLPGRGVCSGPLEHRLVGLVLSASRGGQPHEGVHITPTPPL